MRAWIVDNLNDRSNAVGDNGLNYYARLLGVSSKIAEGDAQNLATQRIREEVQKIRAATSSLESLVK